MYASDTRKLWKEIVLISRSFNGSITMEFTREWVPQERAKYGRHPQEKTWTTFNSRKCIMSFGVSSFFTLQSILLLALAISLTAHNWQKWKRVFLTCLRHEIYRDKAVGLKSCKYTWKITIMWICRIWGNFKKNRYFVNNCLIQVQI